MGLQSKACYLFAVRIEAAWQTYSPAVSVLNLFSPRSIAEKPFLIPTLPITWIASLWLGVLGSGFATILLYYLLHEIGPTRTSLVTYIFPVGGVILGVLFLDEQISWQLLTGSAIIIASLAVVNYKPRTSPSNLVENPKQHE